MRGQQRERESQRAGGLWEEVVMGTETPGRESSRRQDISVKWRFGFERDVGETGVLVAIEKGS